MVLIDAGVENRNRLPGSGETTRPGIGASNKRHTLRKTRPIQLVFLNVNDVIGLPKRFDSAGIDLDSDDRQLVVSLDRGRIITNQIIDNPFPHATDLEALRLRFDLLPDLGLV